MERIDDKNPVSNNGTTPLHSAAQNGHLNVCDYIIGKVENKNPGRNDGDTPLHVAIR